MSFTYLEVVNDVLSELNEVLLTESTFASARNVQRTVKEMVNRAYMDINNPIYKWPWLSVDSPINNFYGNTYITTSEGQRWYKFNPSSTDINDEYGHVDWNSFMLTEEGVAGKEAPFSVYHLPYVEAEEWRKWWGVREAASKENPASFQKPLRVIRGVDKRSFGLSPIPDGEYRIYFYAWTRPSPLIYYNDVVNLPTQYKGVLIARARYYAWQRKEQAPQAGIALEEYKDGLKGMLKQEQNAAPNGFTDDRTRLI